MDYAILKAELLEGHPDTGAYEADDAIAAEQLNTVNRSRDKTSMTGSEILNAIDKAEYLALSEADKDRTWKLLHLGTLNPFGVEAELIANIFGGGSATVAALKAACKEDISRANERGFGTIYEGHIQQARAMP